ncbi:MAG: hypothetical protein AAGU32_20525, partial [Bacillota bacterium]
AIVATIVTKSVKAKEKEPATLKVDTGSGTFEMMEKVPFSRKLKWLTNMLWGGSVLLAFEHVWHGEVVPWFPFLTAASDSSDAAVMLHEMSTVGVSMALLVTAIWVCMLLASNAIEKRALKVPQIQPAGN